MLPALRRRLAGSEGALLFVVLCGLLLVVPGLVVPTFTRIFVDDVPGRRPGLDRPAAAAGHGRDRRSSTALLTWLQQLLPAAPRDQAGARHVEPLLQARPAPARRPTSPSASPARSARASRSTTRSRSSVAAGSRRTVIDSVLMVFYAALMFLYDVALTLVVHRRCRLLNVAAVEAGEPRAHRRQPAPAAGPRQAARARR